LTNSNTASGTNGGGIRADGGLILTGGTIQGNTAANFVAVSTTTAATISGATFKSNSAKQGGGVYVITGALAVTDTVFDSNTATTNGGGATLG